jgi:hypothetical protein
MSDPSATEHTDRYEGLWDHEYVLASWQHEKATGLARQLS